MLALQSASSEAAKRRSIVVRRGEAQHDAAVIANERERELQLSEQETIVGGEEECSAPLARTSASIFALVCAGRERQTSRCWAGE
jgi:hypothetical protein